MKKLSIILIMLFLALSQNTKAEKNCMTAIGYYNMDDPECREKMNKKLKEQGEKLDKELSAGKVYKELMEKERIRKVQEKQARYDAALEQLKSDNPNFKKPTKPTETSNKNELTRDNLIEYRRKTKNSYRSNAPR